jgi:hypothetical protein
MYQWYVSTVTDATIRLTEAPRGNAAYARGIFVPGVVLVDVNIADREDSVNDEEACLNGASDFSA